MSYAALPPLGAYTSFNVGPMSKEIVAHGGATDSNAMAAYAKIAGAAGAGALCAAYSAGAAAGLCASVGAALVDVFAGHVGAPATSGAGMDAVGYWNQVTRPQVLLAVNGQMAIRAYLTMRDQAIDDLAHLAQTVKGGLNPARAWVDQQLTQRGMPPAPIRPEWAPRADFWDTYKATAFWSQNPLGPPPHLLGSKYPYASGDWCSNHGDSDAFLGKTASQMAQLIFGAPPGACAEFLLVYFYPFGAPSPPGDPIDWGMIGAWEIAHRWSSGYAGGQLNQYAQGLCRIPTTHGWSIVKKPDASVANVNFWLNENKGRWNQPAEVITAAVVPSQIATGLILNLQDSVNAIRDQILKMTQGLVGASPAAIQAQQAALAQAASTKRVIAAGIVLAASAAAVMIYRRRK